MLIDHLPRSRRARMIAGAIALFVIAGGTLSGLIATRAHSGTVRTHSPLPQSLATADVRDAGYAGSSPWALTSGKLEVGTTNGSWKDVTPPGIDPTMIRAAAFLDAGHGWVAVSGPDGSNGAVPLIVYRTEDGGKSWQPGKVDASILLADSARAAAHFAFVDSNNGWLEADMASSASFRLGNLYRTTDGGATWTRLQIPYGGTIVFTSPTDGFLTGGVEGNRLSITRDAGATWTPVTVPEASSGVIAGPSFSDGKNGVLTVTTATNHGSTVTLETTSDGGVTWTAATRQAAGPAESVGPAPIAATASGQWLTSLGPGDSLLRNIRGSTTVVTAAGLPGADVGRVISLSYGSAGRALAVVQGGVCEGFKTDCHEFGALFSSGDDGASWQQLKP